MAGNTCAGVGEDEGTSGDDNALDEQAEIDDPSFLADVGKGSEWNEGDEDHADEGDEHAVAKILVQCVCLGDAVGLAGVDDFANEDSEDEADDAGCVLMMGYTGDSLDRQSRILQTMLEYRLDGVVLSPATGTTAKNMASLVRSGQPHVLVTRRVRHHVADYIGPEYPQRYQPIDAR